jgi:hypothetical protein
MSANFRSSSFLNKKQFAVSGYAAVFAAILLSCTPSVWAQTPSPNVPNYSDVVATEITNTQGQWVRIDPAQPNNIDLVETRIFKMPKRGQGIRGVEFKLVGGDGGTSHFQDLFNNSFANGGRGGEVNFTLRLDKPTSWFANQNGSDRLWEKPFIVTFGKKGESVSHNANLRAPGAGGGGSTGMCWLPGGVNSGFLNRKSGYGFFVAAAGGGSGGFALYNNPLHGNSANGNASGSWAVVDMPDDLYASVYGVFTTTSSGVITTVYAGGSRMRNRVDTLNASLTNPNWTGCLTTGMVQNVFTTAQNIGTTFLTSVTHGQHGGKPRITITPPTSTVPTSFTPYSGFGQFDVNVTKAGGRGGAGLAGGGAGVSVTNYNYTWNIMPTSGAGGSGTPTYWDAKVKTYPQTAEAGHNDYHINTDYNGDNAGPLNTSITQRSSTATPQSGYMMYRTLPDNTPPYVHWSFVDKTVTLKGNSPFAMDYMSYNSRVTLEEFLAPYMNVGWGIYDEDGIASVTGSETEFTCFMAGQTIPLYLTITDFAGNVTNHFLWVTVVDPYTPHETGEYSTNIWDPAQPRRINVTNGPVTLTAANFPTPFDGCKGSTGVITHFPATTFTCADAGNQPVQYWYEDSDGHFSDTLTKVFIVEYNAPEIIYVDASATGANNGLSWADAYTSLQNALNLSCIGSGGRKIYVAEGTYHPDAGTGITPNNRNASFTLNHNVMLYGGFPAGGAIFENRNPQSHATILSGAVGSAAATDNSYHIVTIAGTETLLEGFTLKDGYANDNANTGGGGLFLQQTNTPTTYYHNATIRNCKFLDNYGNNGGAIYTDHQSQYWSNRLYIQNCLFEGNTAQNGAAVYLSNHNLTGITNIYQYLVNCVFNNNTATANGAALYIKPNANVDMANCTFAYNNAATGGGTVYNAGTAKLHNSILYFNTTDAISNTGTFHADYNNIEGSGGSAGWSLTGVQDYGDNIDTNPMFHTSPALSLLPASPCRNAGKNSYNSELYDIYGGNYRIRQDVIDIGAFETDFIVYVAADAPAGGDGTSWATAFNNLNDGLSAAGTGVLQKDVWVKKGTYRPDRVGWPLNAPPTPGNRENTFRLYYTLKIYGGFAGTENSIAQRNIGANPTILSGDIGTLNDASDNVYHVVYMQSVNSHIDGFIIEGGNANGIDGNSRGGGVYNDPMYGTNANKLVANCVFRNNHAADKGGAWYSRAIMLGGTDFVQSVFYNNTAGRGAAVYIGEHSHFAGPVEFNYYNVTATNNTSSASGAGAFEAEQFPAYPVKHTFYNALLAGNMPQNYNDVTNPGNITLHNTYTAASATGVFANPSNPAGADGKIMTADDGLQLSRYSLAISYGEDTLLYSGTDKDIVGNPRIISTIDAGAYESPYDMPLIADANGVIYVRTTAFGDGTGSSWENATADLHNAIHATNVQKVFVATGRYNVGNHSFIMKNGVEIYGGFVPDNGIRNLSHERIMPNPKNNSPENSELYGQYVRPVVWNIFTASTAMNNTAVLDGFMITGGKHTTGGGVRNIYASPTFKNVVINSNRALNAGGGMYNENSSPILTNVIISWNGINTLLDPVGGVPVYGGGMYNTANSNPVLTNVTIAENFIRTESAATQIGPGIYNLNSSPVIRNSIFWNNAKGFNITSPGVDIENSGNVNLTLQNSMTQGYTTGNPANNNIVAGNPMFAVAGNKDYRLTIASPAINAGDNSWLSGLNAGTKDLAGNPRVFDFANNNRIDMGAYEYQCLVTDYSTVSFDSITVVYDGNPHSIAVQGLPQGVAATYEIMNEDSVTTTGNTAINAGVYTITATINPVVSGTDCVPEIKTATLTINKAAAIITTDSIQTHVYDGTVKNITATLNHTEDTLGYTAQQGYTDAGVYWINVSAPETDNYLSASEVVGLVIEKADFTGIALNDSTFTYDSTAKYLTISGTLPAGATLDYGGNGQIDTGIYMVVAFIQKPNYNDLWLSAQMEITSNINLPVTMVSFTAEKRERTALLEWSTVIEQNCKGFDIERSPDGLDWSKIGYQHCLADDRNNTYKLDYSFTDYTPLNGKNYYRLKQTDFDDAYAYSAIRVLTFSRTAEVKMYPNPVAEILNVTGLQGGETLSIIDALGKVIKEQKVEAETTKISLKGLSDGVYHILIQSDGKEIKSFKVVKQN